MKARKWSIARRGLSQYIRAVPDVVPADLVLVHNRVQAYDQIGANGFRVWLQQPKKGISNYKPCSCDWAPHLGQHYWTGTGKPGSMERGRRYMREQWKAGMRSGQVFRQPRSAGSRPELRGRAK
jgi:hypothetical protein